MIVITEAAKRMLLELLERRCAHRRSDLETRRTSAPGRFLRLHSVTRTGLLGVVLDRPRATDRTVELGRGELLLVNETLARAIDGFVLDRDERGSISLRTGGAARAGAAHATGAFTSSGASRGPAV